jgi:hypothetical protein
MALNFDGITLPKISILAGIGTGPGTSCIVDHGVIGTNLVGGVATVDIAADAQSLTIKRGRDSDIDAATPGTCTIVLDNTSGAYDQTNPNSPYATSSSPMLAGLGLNPDQTAGEVTSDLDHLEAVGITALWVVLAVEWAFPSSTTIDATIAGKYDNVINGASARGIPVIIQAHGCPTWINAAGTWHGPNTSTERSNWVTCVHNFINRYGASKIDWVEIWNEPNLTSFWTQGANANEYARLLQAAYVDIKASWPTIKVVGHAMSRNDLGWLDAVYTQTDTVFGASTAAANKYYFDVLGIHPYCGDSTSGFDPNDDSHADEGGFGGGGLDPDFVGYRRLRAATLTKEGTAKPLGFGEFGYTTDAGWFSVSEATRATYLASGLQIAAADGYVEYLVPFFHDSFGTVGGGFNLHGTSTETSFTSTVAALTGSIAGSTIELGIPVEIRMEWPLGTVYKRFVGELVDIDLDLGYSPTATWTFADGLENLGRAYLPLETTPILAGDLCGIRIGHLADRADWPIDKRALDNGNNLLGGTLLGASALELMRQVESTEFGLLFVDGAGQLVFYDRYRTSTANRSTLVQARLTDTAATNEVEMLGLSFARSRERVYNRVAITRQPRVEFPDEQPVEQVADDPVSQAAHGVLGFPGQVGELLTTDTEALAMAQGLVGRFKDPANRIREVRIDAIAQGEWDVLLPLGLLDRISVSRDYGPNTITGELLIQGSEETVSDQGPSWDFTFTTSPTTTTVADACEVGFGLVGTHKTAW